MPEKSQAKTETQPDSRLSGILSEDRPQPSNLKAERAVLASMLAEPDPCIDIAIEQLKSADVFYDPAHRTLFKKLCDLYQESSSGIDLITVADALSRENKLERIGGEMFLMDLQNSVATTANLEAWCGLVREFSVLRNMINVCSMAVDKCYSPEKSVADLIDEIEGRIYDVRYKHTDPEILDLKEHINHVFKELQKVLSKEVEVGIPTGYPDLDHLIVGLKKGEMVVLAARPSIGKTALALNITHKVAMKGEKGRPIAFFSLEMTADQIARRLLSLESEIPESAFYDGSFKSKKMDITKLTQAVSNLKKANLFIDPTGGLTVAELRAKARRLHAQHKIELVVIDYLQLMKVGGGVDSRQQEVAEISSGIKKLAKDLNVPVLVLAQLNREVEKGTSPKAARPKLSHLRESGAIEQDADIVIFLHRDRSETRDASKEAQINGVKAELIVEKNRNGRTGIVEVMFHPMTMKFKAASRYGMEDRPERADNTA